MLLLDEPFGALDKNLRLDMQIEVKGLQRLYGVTTMLVLAVGLGLVAAALPNPQQRGAQAGQA